MKKFREVESVKAMELSHWWVRERYTMVIGVIGDETALTALREILTRAPAERHKYDSPEIDMSDSQDRFVYLAINAITRLTKKDVRPKPVEEMDVEATRRKVLELLAEGN
jgi:NADPH-dependent ferric siderophore reductase